MDEILFPDKIVIEGKEYEFDLESDLKINDADLNSEFCKQAKLFAIYATAYERALHDSSLLKVKLDRLCAHLEYQGRMEATSAGIKFTEKMADAYVNGHAQYLEANTELLKYQEIVGLLKHAKDAIVQKRDMLMQLGASQREELRSNIMVK